MANILSQAEVDAIKAYGWVSQQVALHPKTTVVVGFLLILASNLIGVFRHI